MSSALSTFLFTDIEGSTRLWEEHADGMGVALAEHDRLLELARSDGINDTIAPWDWRARNKKTAILGAAKPPENASTILLASASGSSSSVKSMRASRSATW